MAMDIANTIGLTSEHGTVVETSTTCTHTLEYGTTDDDVEEEEECSHDVYIRILDDAEAQVKNEQDLSNELDRPDFDNKIVKLLELLSGAKADLKFLSLLRSARTAWSNLAEYQALLDETQDTRDEISGESSAGNQDEPSDDNQDEYQDEIQDELQENVQYSSLVGYHAEYQDDTQHESQHEWDDESETRSEKRGRFCSEDEDLDYGTLSKKPKYAINGSQSFSGIGKAISSFAGKSLIGPHSEQQPPRPYGRNRLGSYAGKSLPGAYSGKSLPSSHIGKTLPATIARKYPPGESSSKSIHIPQARPAPPKRGAWSDAEYNVIFAAVKGRREFEEARGLKGLRDVAFWKLIQEALGAEGYSRTHNSCKNFWSREGRQRSGFEERTSPPKDGCLVSSAQVSKRARSN